MGCIDLTGYPRNKTTYSQTLAHAAGFCYTEADRKELVFVKNKWNILLLAVYLISAPVCAVLSITNLGILSLVLPVLPSFCSQLLLCRVSRRRWVQALPLLPVAALLAMAGFYLIRDSGWDRLAALIFGVAGIAPAVGVGLGWSIWYLMQRKQQENE